MDLLKKFSLILLISLMVGGCSSKEEQPSSRLEASQKLIQILESDYSYTPVTRWAGETLWIYLPSNSPLYAIEGSQKSSSPTKKKYTLQYIDVAFNNETFTLEYDIVEATKVSSGSGMSTRYSQEFNEQYRNATAAISRTFFTAEQPPQFIILVIADIKKGLETKTTFYTEDLKKYFAQGIPSDEYGLRIQTEPSGDQKIIDDTKGKHLEYKAVGLAEFLAKQIAYRITFKFQNSDFPPDKSIEDEILNATASALEAYAFKDFSSVVLNDLRTGQEKSFSKDQITALEESLPQEKSTNEGKIVTIDFSQFLEEQPEESLPTKKADEPLSEN